MSENTLIAKLNMIASKIQHEDNLIGQRATWLVISQSFLFGAFVAAVAEVGRAGTMPRLAKLLLVVIPLLGVLLPVPVLLAVAAASFSLRQCRAERDRILVTPEAGELDWPRLDRRAVLVFGQLLPHAAALGFLASWLAILMVHQRMTNQVREAARRARAELSEFRLLSSDVPASEKRLISGVRSSFFG